jgi:hypothetical protein
VRQHISYSQVASEEPVIQQTNNKTADISGQLTMFLNEVKNVLLTSKPKRHDINHANHRYKQITQMTNAVRIAIWNSNGLNNHIGEIPILSRL